MPTFMPKPKSMCPGASCPGCSSAQCYAGGGKVKDKLVKKKLPTIEIVPHPPDVLDLTPEQVENFKKRMADPKKKMAEGGSVLDSTHRRDNEKGINKASIRSPGTSEAGAALHPAFSVHEDIDKDVAKRRHHKVLGEMRAMKKPKLYAQGGEVSQQDKVDVLRAQDKYPEFIKAQAEKLGLTKYEAKGGEIDSDGDEELHHAIGSELLDALEKKDKKGIMSALTAAIMQCMGDES